VLIISNTGSAGMTAKFGSAPASATDGFAITAGDRVTLKGDEVSQADPVYGLSIAGTSFYVAQGVAVVPRA
jgi:hypothetical protein